MKNSSIKLEGDKKLCLSLASKKNRHATLIPDPSKLIHPSKDFRNIGLPVPLLFVAAWILQLLEAFI